MVDTSRVYNLSAWFCFPTCDLSFTSQNLRAIVKLSEDKKYIVVQGISPDHRIEKLYTLDSARDVPRVYFNPDM